MSLEIASIYAAHERIRDKIHRTPVMSSTVLNEKVGAELFFKCEHLQRVGAFKSRGATNAVYLLSDDESQRGVVTHSSGNHAAALSYAAALRGIPAYIVMPTTAPRAKQEAVRRYGGEIFFCEPNLPARERAAEEVRLRTGATFIHPYNDPRVMAGQGTTAVELLEDVRDLDLILCPVGGGGLLSGVATAAKALQPAIQVIGVEPAGADDAYQSFRSGILGKCAEPDSIADGLLTSLGSSTFAQIRRHVTDIVTVSDRAIGAAMRTIWEVLKQVVEPSGAVPYAALTERKLAAEGRRVAIILTGGNLDLDVLPWQKVAD